MVRLKKKGKSESLKAYSFLSLALIFFMIFLVYPIIFSIVLSFFKWSGFSRNPFTDFIGLKNYLRIFSDPNYYTALKNTLYFVFLELIFQNLFGFCIALFLFYGKLKASALWRSIIFFPAMLSSVMIGLVWRRIFMGDGLINIIISKIIPGSSGFPWLSNTITPIFVIIFIDIWQWTGYSMVIYYAGLQGVNKDLIESAKVDGANWFQTITRILIPQLYKTISLAVILNIIGGFKVFDIVYVMTGGGPARSSEVLTSQIFYESFSSYGTNKMGYSSALAVFFTLTVLIFVIIRLWLEKKSE